MSDQHFSQYIAVPPHAVYRALLDPDLIGQWRATHEGLPHGVLPSDNELGWRESLGKLVRLLETQAS